MKTLDDLKFDLKDCLIEGATRQVGTQSVPVIYGVSVANIRNGMQMTQQEVNAITVTHLPTGITFTADRGSPKLNRETAIAAVRAMVEKAIASAKEAGANSNDVPGT